MHFSEQLHWGLVWSFFVSLSFLSYHTQLFNSCNSGQRATARLQNHRGWFWLTSWLIVCFDCSRFAPLINSFAVTKCVFTSDQTTEIGVFFSPLKQWCVALVNSVFMLNDVTLRSQNILPLSSQTNHHLHGQKLDFTNLFTRITTQNTVFISVSLKMRAKHFVLLQVGGSTCWIATKMTG